MPLPPEENTGGQLGRMSEGSELIIVDSPSRVTTLSTLKRAQQLRDTKMGGFRSVTVLGWNFSADIAQALTNLADDRLNVRVIPPDLLDRLKKKGVAGLAGNIRFSTLQYLEAHLEARFTSEKSEQLTIALDNYVLVDPQAINLDEDNREKLLKVMNAEPLALIEYWAVDPDYDGVVFRSLWQDYRGNTENDNDPLRVISQANLTIDRLDRARKVCVRAVDVFGFESEVVLDVPVAS
jgi:adenine-specific DNA-methyltransferase